MTDGCATPSRECFTGCWRQVRKEAFEVHDSNYHHMVICNATPTVEFTRRSRYGRLSVMQLREIRVVNLRRYLREALKGNQSELARLLDKKPSYINDLLRDRPQSKPKSFGEKIARDIERRLGLESGTLDKPPPENGNPGGVAQIVPFQKPWPFSVSRERYDDLGDSEKARIDERITTIVEQFERTAKAKRRRRKPPS